MEVVFILFKSTLPKDQVIKNFEARADLYRAVPGLVQKYYVHDDATGHFGGIHILILTLSYGEVIYSLNAIMFRGGTWDPGDRGLSSWMRHARTRTAATTAW